MTKAMASIARLFSACGPYAIVEFVSSVVVATFDGVLRRWTRTHISKEHDEVVPAFTDFDTATAVVGEAWIVRVAASSEHSNPNVVFRQKMGLPVLEVSRRSRFAVKASARASSTGAQVVAECVAFLAAIAKAIPLLFGGIVGDCDQAPEASIRDVNKSWHEMSIVA
jgi:hypothetical protein